MKIKNTMESLALKHGIINTNFKNESKDKSLKGTINKLDFIKACPPQKKVNKIERLI